MNKFIDFNDIENSFSDDNDQLDSIRFELTRNSDDKDFDSVVRNKFMVGEKMSQETVKQNNIHQSPDVKGEKKIGQNSQNRISFGFQNSLQKINPQRLLFNSSTNSVRSSAQMDPNVLDTASFPQYLKFAQRLKGNYQRNSIEEDSAEHESSMNQSKDASLRQKTRQSVNKKLNLTIATEECNEGNSQDEEQIPTRQRVNTQISQDQLEFFIIQLAEEMEREKCLNDELIGELEKQRQQNQRSHKLNRELCRTLEQTQETMMSLVRQNKILQKKNQMMDSGDRRRTFQTSDSEYLTKNKENSSSRSNKLLHKK